MSILSPTYCLRQVARKYLTTLKTSPCEFSQLKTITPEKHVVLSQSDCIYTNLALEDWLYENADLESRSYLLLWRNKPTVVIGRHQNPWIESNVPEVLKQGISLVRRKSGGGTVYHDTGNLNCSILTNRKLYKRKENLKLIVNAIESRWEIPLVINNRDDIMLEGLYKVDWGMFSFPGALWVSGSQSIAATCSPVLSLLAANEIDISGTAAKLGGKRSYHHFTLLFDADLSQIGQLLTSPVMGAETKATGSVPGPVKNLSDYDSSICFESLTDAIAKQFVARDSALTNPNVQEIFPTESDFPGIRNKIQELKDPEWIFGKTPKFSICRDFVLSTDTFSGSNCNLLTLKINCFIDKGQIEDLEVISSGITDNSVLDLVKRLQSYLSSKRLYSRKIIFPGQEMRSGNVISECLSELQNYIDVIPETEKRTADWIIQCFQNVFNFS